MAYAQPLYTIADQLNLLSTNLPYGFPYVNLLRLRLLLACSKDGNIDTAKNRFLFLIQDTEMNTIFSSVIEVPLERMLEGASSIQEIHNKFESYYSKFPELLRELQTLGVPQATRILFDTYFYSNEDPVYKLSTMATMIMFAYIKDDQINNRKE